jgi:hypothetical protein
MIRARSWNVSEPETSLGRLARLRLTSEYSYLRSAPLPCASSRSPWPSIRRASGSSPDAASGVRWSARFRSAPVSTEPVRCGLRQRVCLECGRHPDCDSSGRAGSVSRYRKRSDATGGAQYGARHYESPRVCRFSEVWAGTCRGAWQGRGSVIPGSFTLMVLERGAAAR